MLAHATRLSASCSCQDMLASLALVPRHAGQPRPCWPTSSSCWCQDMLAGLQSGCSCQESAIGNTKAHPSNRIRAYPYHSQQVAELRLWGDLIEMQSFESTRMQANNQIFYNSVAPKKLTLPDKQKHRNKNTSNILTHPQHSLFTFRLRNPRASKEARRKRRLVPKHAASLAFVLRHRGHPKPCSPAWRSCHTMLASLVFVPKNVPAWWCSCQDMGQPGVCAKTWRQPGVFVPGVCAGQPGVRPKTCQPVLFVPRHAGQPGVRGVRANTWVFVKTCWPAWCSCKTCWPAWCSCHHILASLLFVPRHGVGAKTCWSACQDQTGVRAKTCWPAWCVLAKTCWPAWCVLAKTCRSARWLGTSIRLAGWHEHLAGQHVLARTRMCCDELASMSWHEHQMHENQAQHVVARTRGASLSTNASLASMSWCGGQASKSWSMSVMSS